MVYVRAEYSRSNLKVSPSYLLVPVCVMGGKLCIRCADGTVVGTEGPVVAVNIASTSPPSASSSWRKADFINTPWLLRKHHHQGVIPNRIAPCTFVFEELLLKGKQI